MAQSGKKPLARTLARLWAKFTLSENNSKLKEHEVESESSNQEKSSIDLDDKLKKGKNKKRSSWVSKLLQLSEFALPLKSWGRVRDIVISIVLASFLVNVLSLVFPFTLLQIYDRIIPNQSVGTLFWLAFAVFSSVAIVVVMRLLRAYVGGWADAKFEHIVGCEAFNKIMECDLSDYEAEGTGRHLKRLNALNTMRDFYAGQAIISIVDVPFALIFLLLILYIAKWLVLVPLFMVFLLFIFAMTGSAKVTQLMNARQDHDNRRLNFIVETLSKIHTIKSNTMEAQMLRRFERLQKTSSGYDFSVMHKNSAIMSESMTLSQMTLAIVVAVGSIMVFNGLLTVGGLAAATLLSGRTLQPVSSLLSLWSRIQAIKIAREEFDLVLKMKSESLPGLKKIQKVKGDIEFQQVDFRYSDESPFLLKDCNLKIPAKSMITIKGGGVAGKSTLFWLLLKINQPTGGRILIDNQDISALEPYRLREYIGLMPQDFMMFQGSIMDNLTMFRPELEEAAFKASAKVGLADVIQHFPDGYDTMVGQQAVANLARGVAQRVVIARALVRNPPIILFDEANVALDISSDNQIRELMIELQKEHTIILISHRPSYLSLSEHQYEFHNGKLRLVT